MEIRDAVESDFGAITAIYNEILTNSTAIYSDQAANLEQRIAWWRERQRLQYPVLVAVESDTVLGFASFGGFRTWPGYRYSVECSIHLDRTARGRGIGTELMTVLICRARDLGKHTLIAGVDSENIASLRFFERLGFERVAYLPEVGHKFGRFLNLHLLQYWLTPRTDSSESKPADRPS
jgi:L-amino acid N-acyltransferase